MAQAESISTAVRQPMSRGQPPKSTSPVRPAHTKLIAALPGNIPQPIYAGANADDLDSRADHLEKVFAALHAYLVVIIGNTAQNVTGGTLDDRYVNALFQDVLTAAVCVIRNAAEEMREHENWGTP
jgi:hypothetical protein